MKSKLMRTISTGMALAMCVALLAMPLGIASAATQISMDDARNTALAHAGLTTADVQITKQKLDYDNRIAVYDIEFSYNGIKYEYEIDAASAEIIEYSHKSKVRGSANANDIGLEAARQIALNDVGAVATDVAFTKTKKDKDDGIAIYDIEFTFNSMKYEYEINAATGAITEYSRKAVGNRGSNNSNIGNNTNTGTSSGNYTGNITLNDAKHIAFNKIGVCEADVTMKKAKQDYDDGVAEYDIEFTYNGYKYEFEINASTGRITDYDVERQKRR